MPCCKVDENAPSIGRYSALLILSLLAGAIAGAWSAYFALRDVSLTPDVVRAVSQRATFYVDILTALVLLFTAVVVVVYTIETGRLRKATTEAGTFDALSSITQQLNNVYNYNLRGPAFDILASTVLAFAIQELVRKQGLPAESVLKDLGDGRKCVHLGPLLERLRADPEDLELFRAKLEQGLPPRYPESFLVAAEVFLLSLNSVAVPLTLNLAAAKVAAKAYKPMVESTARFLVPFLAIEARLSDDTPEGRKSYLEMLERLKILPPEFKLRDAGSIYATIEYDPMLLEGLRNLRLFTQAFNSIYGTQIHLLQYLAEDPGKGETYDGLARFYNEFAELSKPITPDRAAYFEWLKRQGFIECEGWESDQIVRVTPLGQSFLAFISMRYPTVSRLF